MALWSFIAALGRFANPAELLAAYGIANMLAQVALTPGGIGIIEASTTTLLISFGLSKNVSTLAVLGWRLLNFWLPIPLGALAYLSLKAPQGKEPPGSSEECALEQCQKTAGSVKAASARERLTVRAPIRIRETGPGLCSRLPGPGDSRALID